MVKTLGGVLINFLLIPFVLAVVFPSIALAKLTGEPRDDFITSAYHSCQSSKGSGKQMSGEALAKKSRFCNCSANKMADALDIETLKRMESEQTRPDREFLELLGNNAVQWCKEHYMEYGSAPPVSEMAQKKDTNGSVLFNGKPHRFTAFRQRVFTKDYQLVREIELENGRKFYDLNIQPGGTGSGILDVTAQRKYSLAPFAGSSPKLREFGFDFAFWMKAADRPATLLFLDSKQGLLATQILNASDGLIYETHYVRSQALICTALKEAKNQALKAAAWNFVKEILLVAIKSYAGASYSGGTFTAYTSTGKTVSGTYTKYDPSWLGEHYARGLDAVFSGTASLADINGEMARLECGSL